MLPSDWIGCEGENATVFAVLNEASILVYHKSSQVILAPSIKIVNDL
jgi:hypothetical protein